MVRITLVSLVIASVFIQPVSQNVFFNRHQAHIDGYPFYQIGNYIQKITTPDERVIIQDQDWSSAGLYAANRRGFMIRHSTLDKTALIDNGFTTYVKKEYSAFDENISSFNHVIMIETSVPGWEIYKFYDSYSDLEDFITFMDNYGDDSINYFIEIKYED